MTGTGDSKRDDGRFKKGHVRKGGRAKGTPNKHTRNVKEWLLQAAMNIGFDGKGKNGGTGFTERTGRANPEALLAALTKLLPRNDDTSSPTNNIATVNIISVPSGTFLTPEQIRQLQSGEELHPSPVIEHQPVEAANVTPLQRKAAADGQG